MNKIDNILPLQIASKITKSHAYGQVVTYRQVPYHLLHRDISKVLCEEISVLITAMQWISSTKEIIKPEDIDNTCYWCLGLSRCHYLKKLTILCERRTS